MKSKQEVGYANGMGNDRCKRCTHFLPPTRCELVRGSISPEGWCRLFDPKGDRNAKQHAQAEAHHGRRRA